MCGIVGYVGSRDCVDLLIDGTMRVTNPKHHGGQCIPLAP